MKKRREDEKKMENTIRNSVPDFIYKRGVAQGEVNLPDIKINATQDADVGDGDYSTKNYVLTEGIWVSEENTEPWKGVVQFNLEEVEISPTSTGILLL